MAKYVATLTSVLVGCSMLIPTCRRVCSLLSSSVLVSLRAPSVYVYIRLERMTSACRSGTRLYGCRVRTCGCQSAIGSTWRWKLAHPLGKRLYVPAYAADAATGLALNDSRNFSTIFWGVKKCGLIVAWCLGQWCFVQ